MHGIILTHGNAKEITELHSITWNKYLDSYEILCPQDDAIYLQNIKTTLCGLGEHHGNHNIERQWTAFEIASKYKVSAVMEYDTVLLDKLPIPDDMQLYANHRFENGEIYVADWWSDCPWVVTQKTAKIIASYKSRFLDAIYCDRWLSAVCDDSNIIHKTIPYSYSPFGEKTDRHRIIEIKTAIRKYGAKCIHGNKDIELAKQIVDYILKK